MAKALLICGKICSGKSCYSEQLRKQNNAVVLSCDEIAQTIFENQLGESHDETVSRIKRYLFRKSIDLIKADCDVILDWGFWSRGERAETSDFYRSQGIECQWHYVEIDHEDWYRNIADRNEKVVAGVSNDYYVDEGLLNKLLTIFEVPRKEEMDVWFHSHRD